jgi:hypothetical protein
MIATRFNTVMLAACVAIAALSCYLISLRVASERAQVDRTERRLLAAQEDIRSLQTELNTRSRLVQLERWNADVLALTAPKAHQYLAGEMQLASLATTTNGNSGAGSTQLASASADTAGLQAPAELAQIAYRKVDAGQMDGGKPATRLVHSVNLDLDQPAGRPMLRRVALMTYLDGKTRRP